MPRKLHARMFNSQNRWSKCNDWQLLSPCITTAIKDIQNFYTKSPIYSRTWLIARRVMLSPFNCVDSQFDDDVDPFSQFLTKEFPSYHSGLAHRAAVTSVSHHKHAHNIHPEKKKNFQKMLYGDKNTLTILMWRTSDRSKSFILDSQPRVDCCYNARSKLFFSWRFLLFVPIPNKREKQVTKMSKRPRSEKARWKWVDQSGMLGRFHLICLFTGFAELRASISHTYISNLGTKFSHTEIHLSTPFNVLSEHSTYSYLIFFRWLTSSSLNDNFH